MPNRAECKEIKVDEDACAVERDEQIPPLSMSRIGEGASGPKCFCSSQVSVIPKHNDNALKLSHAYAMVSLSSLLDGRI